MKTRILSLLLLLLPLLGKASHIVGGEFEILYQGNFRYKINFIYYFDEKNGAQEIKQADIFINARIFRFADNAFIRDVSIPFHSQTPVSYTQPACSSTALKTSRQYYTTEITMPPEQFSHPGGYYIVWERCCRNYNSAGLLNIFSVDPGNSNNNPNAAGQTFYLKFPPVTKNGQPFVNSTPKLFPPLSDYGSPFRPYYTDFRGIDDDGDSLVYSMTTPYNTHQRIAYPPIMPAPFPEVVWRPPFSFTNMMGGSPDLKISQEGFLTVTPTLQGLFVFAVKVEEYRDKVKIGETRRDFQMLVIEAADAVPPKIIGKGPTDPDFVDSPTLTMTYTLASPASDRCFTVRVTDDDSKITNDTIEQIRIRAIPLNFKKDLAPILPSVFYATLREGSSAEFTICLPVCPYFIGGTPMIGIIAMDDACALPLTDTLKVSIHAEAPPNNQPRFTSINPITQTLQEGDQDAWPFSVVDDDGDNLTISVIGKGFSLPASGFQFTTLSNTPGAANGELKWDAFCDIYDFTQRTSFQVIIQVEDDDFCKLPNPAKAIHNLTVNLPGNDDPIIDSDLTSNPAERKVSLTRRVYESVNFKVTGKDVVDNDFLVLKSEVQSFESTESSIAISPTPTSANTLVSSDVAWTVGCDVLSSAEPDTVNLQFIVVDNANKCRIYKADTLDVEVKVLPPANHAPVLSVFNQNADHTDFVDGVLSVTLGASIDLLLTGNDADVTPAKDNLTLKLREATGNVPPFGYTFEQAEGPSPLATTFTWTPGCSIFKRGIFENEYTFTFDVYDDRCHVDKKDSVTFTIRIKDVDGSDANFRPPNFVSPNGDEKNDYYAMETLVPETGELLNILPNDNCDSRFEYVRIYNRWGKEMFRSTERDFKWYPDDTSSGVYYYSIKFTKKEYRGSLTVRY